jgi:malonyl-CoA decarboxylase
MPSPIDGPRAFFRQLLNPGNTDVPGGVVRHPRVVARLLDLCSRLLSERGEASGVRLGAEAVSAFYALSPDTRSVFFDNLASAFSPNASGIDRAVDAYRTDYSQTHLAALQAAVESPRQELFRRINRATGGTAALIDMRSHVLDGLKEHAAWAAIDQDLLHLFRSWFNRGFLSLRRLDWRTSALVLERLIEFEAVHQIQGWHDLHRRLETDRRCYAFFHPALPDAPLIFIEVALTRGMSGNVQPLLDPDAKVEDPTRANCATFYSITNCHEGLHGVSFGSLLIKQVAEELAKEFRRLRIFATLSPIPGFVDWLQAVPGRIPAIPQAAFTDRGGGFDALAAPAHVKSQLIGLCAQYLLHAKRGRAPADPVARFHLSNGARLERLNWAGDTSPRGIERSLGLTANYLYQLDSIEENHEQYVKTFRIVVTRKVEHLARGPI